MHIAGTVRKTKPDLGDKPWMSSPNAASNRYCWSKQSSAILPEWAREPPPVRHLACPHRTRRCCGSSRTQQPVFVQPIPGVTLICSLHAGNRGRHFLIIRGTRPPQLQCTIYNGGVTLQSPIMILASTMFQAPVRRVDPHCIALQDMLRSWSIKVPTAWARIANLAARSTDEN